jgi:hypothetical protein
MSQSDESDSSAASICLQGVQAREDSWRIVGSLPADENYFSALVEATEPNNYVDGVVCGGRFYTVRVRIFSWTEATQEEQAISRIANGDEYTDEDGDFDYKVAEMPKLVWQMVYGQIFAPISTEDP